jgi:hypothetical protein
MAMFVKETTLIDIPAGEAHQEISQKSITRLMPMWSESRRTPIIFAGR